MIRFAPLRLLGVLAALASAACAQTPVGVFASQDVESALARAAEDGGKIVVVYVYREYIEPDGARTKHELCQRVEREVLTSPAVIESLSEANGVIAVSVSVDSDQSVFRRLGLEPAYPTFAWLDPDGTVLGVLGASFDPGTYVFFTSTAKKIRELKLKEQPTVDDQRELGMLYFDCSSFEKAQGILSRVAEIDGPTSDAAIVCGFARRRQNDLVGSLEMLTSAVTACKVRNAGYDEVSFAPGYVPPYAPLAFERDGELVGLLYDAGPSALMVRMVRDLEWALTTEPTTVDERERAADVFFDRENWARAADLYATLVTDGPATAGEKHAARSALSSLRAGDGEAAMRGFDVYLEGYRTGPSRPEILFYAGSLLLARSIVMDPETGDYEVRDRAGHSRSAELLIELCEKHSDSGWVEDAKRLLASFFRPQDVAAEGERGDEGEDRPPAGPGAR